MNTGLVVVSGEISTTAHIDFTQIVRDTIRRDRLRRLRLRLRLRGLRGHRRDRQAVRRHRPGRRRRQGDAADDELRRARRGRRRRPGHDVRLRHQRDRRADAAADLPGPQAGRAPAPRCARTARCPTCAPTARPRSPSATATACPVEIENILISTQHAEDVDSATQIRPDLLEHVIQPVLPDELLRRGQALTRVLPGQPDRQVRDRRPGGRLRPDRPQDHRRHLRRHRPATAAAPSRARTRRRSTARPPTPRATWPRTSWPPAWPSAARSRWPTPSASRTRSR